MTGIHLQLNDVIWGEMLGMKKLLLLMMVVSFIFATCGVLAAWDANGIIPGSDVEFSSLAVSKSGVNVRLTNKSEYDVKISLKLIFRDGGANDIGYSILGLREIPAGSYSDISGNYLNGNWRNCRGAERLVWQLMTYEPIYH
jgi:hypothetical protein